MSTKLPDDLFKWLVELRRWFHKFPEPAYNEIKTAAKICETLDNLKVPFQKNVGGTGVVAKLRAKRAGPVVAFRADMDALALKEKNDVSYKSRNPGFMHACGHDGHVAISLGIIRWLIEKQWPQKGCGEIVFIFQPAEEGGAGARAMLKSGVFNTKPIKAIFAGHMFPELPVGHIRLAPEVSNAAADNIVISLKGIGGHGAYPHHCKDPIVAGAYLITQLQSLISRELPPLESAVITVGRFHAGTASNIIPEEAVLEGTLRTLKPEIREEIIKRLEDMVEGMAKSFGIAATLNIADGYPVLVNDPVLVDHVTICATEVLGAGNIHSGIPRMGAEDFAYFCQEWGGVMIGIGCHDPSKGFQHGLHSPYFDIDERVLEVGTRLFAHVLTRYLEASQVL